MAGLLGRFSLVMGLSLLAACDYSAPIEPKTSDQQPLALPQTLENPHVTDQTVVAGKVLAIWNEGGGCKLQVDKDTNPIWLKPMAPCFFMHSPSSDKAQIFQKDKYTFVVAAVGTPTKGERCGQEVQGIVVKRDAVILSAYVMQGSVHCAGQGLHNFQYSLFTNVPSKASSFK